MVVSGAVGANITDDPAGDRVGLTGMDGITVHALASCSQVKRIMLDSPQIRMKIERSGHNFSAHTSHYAYGCESNQLRI